MISSVPVLAAVAAPSTERSSPSRATPTRKTPISPEIIRAPICQDSSLSLDAKKIAKVERNGSPQSRVQIRKNRGSEKILLRKVTWCGAPNYGDGLEPLSPTVVVRSPSAALTESTGFIEFGGWGPMSGSGRLPPLDCLSTLKQRAHGALFRRKNSERRNSSALASSSSPEKSATIRTSPHLLTA